MCGGTMNQRMLSILDALHFGISATCNHYSLLLKAIFKERVHDY